MEQIQESHRQRLRVVQVELGTRMGPPRFSWSYGLLRSCGRSISGTMMASIVACTTTATHSSRRVAGAVLRRFRLLERNEWTGKRNGSGRRCNRSRAVLPPMTGVARLGCQRAPCGQERGTVRAAGRIRRLATLQWVAALPYYLLSGIWRPVHSNSSEARE